MKLDRRHFIGIAAGMAASPWLSSSASLHTDRVPIEAVAFDAFPVFDPRPIFALAEKLFPGKGADLSAAWRTRQFEYQWLRALGGQYADFLRTTEDALIFAAKSLRLELSSETRDALMQEYSNLKVWPDVPEALQALKAAGIRLAFLSNMTEKMLSDNVHRNGLDKHFEHILSTDRIHTYKPDPRAYRMAVDAFKLRRENILFASFAGWDAAGSKWFGYPTYWVNRMGSGMEELSAKPDAVGRNLTDLVDYLSMPATK